jgi:hypothetical protein
MQYSDSIFLYFTIFLISVSIVSTSSFAYAANSIAENNNQDGATISFTKTVSDNKIRQNESTVVTLLVNNAKNFKLENVSITDIIPTVFDIKPAGVFPANTIKQQFPSLSTTYLITYSITPKPNLELSKDWNFQLPAAQLQFAIQNNENNKTQTISLQSEQVPIALLSTKNLEWHEENWIAYLFILLGIAALLGLFGGVVNHIIGYRPNLNLITRNVTYDIVKYNLELNVKYDDNIVRYGKCNVTISCTPKTIPSRPIQLKLRCELFYNEKYGEQHFDIEVSEKKSPKEFSAVVAIENYGANFRIKIIENNTESYLEGVKFDINVERNSILKTSLAGLSAGLITLLFLQIASSLVTNRTFPPTVQSIITLTISAFIAGFIPFQILDKATGQLKEQLKIVDNVIKGKDATIRFERLMRVEVQRISDFERRRFLLSNESKQQQQPALGPDRKAIPFPNDAKVQNLFDKIEELKVDNINIIINGKTKNIKLKDIEYKDLDRRIIDVFFKDGI